MVARCGRISIIKALEEISRREIEIACSIRIRIATTMARKQISAAEISCARQISVEGATTLTSTDLVAEILVRYIQILTAWVPSFLKTPC
jgi:hypothetical protein